MLRVSCCAVSGRGGVQADCGCRAGPFRTAIPISGTDLAYAAVSLRGCYAMSGTDLAYAATSSAPEPCDPAQP
eukprot:1737210-Rhodomonas_salina.2